MPKPYVAIVGRPNVGKSTLFNRLVGERRAVISDIPGTTRDRIVAEAEWNGREFVVVDTGGIEILPERVERGARPLPDSPLLEDSVPFIPLIRAQAQQAVADADVILFVVDAATGLTGADREVADLLRRAEKPLYLVANKADNQRREQEALEFYELGLGTVYPVSAIHGYGIGDLLDLIVEAFPPPLEEPEEREAVHLAILGRPNVGKSSLLNQLLGQERAIVSPVAGTTRDALDTELMWGEERVVLIDTAGIRRRGKIDPGVERYSVLRALKATERADVALLVLDASEGIASQDAHIAGIIAEQGVSLVALANKWDIVPAEVKEQGLLVEAQIRAELQFLPFVPILFISALTGLRVNKVIPTALEIYEARRQRIPTGALNDLLRRALAEHAPPSKKGRRMKLYYATQVDVDPPTFVLFINDPRLVHFSYTRFLENRIREAFPFPGTPIRLVYRGHERDKR